MRDMGPDREDRTEDLAHRTARDGARRRSRRCDQGGHEAVFRLAGAVFLVFCQPLHPQLIFVRNHAILEFHHNPRSDEGSKEVPPRIVYMMHLVDTSQAISAMLVQASVLAVSS